MILCTENPKEYTKKVLELINSANLQDERSKHKNQLFFYRLVINNPKNET